MTLQQMENAYNEPIKNDGNLHGVSIDVLEENYVTMIEQHIFKNWNDNEDRYYNNGDSETRTPDGLSISYCTYLETNEKFITISFSSNNPQKWWDLIMVGKYGMVRNRYGGGHRYRQTYFALSDLPALKASINIDE
jgi:hypothetical protein